MDLNQTKPKPRPDIVDLTPPEKADQDLIKKDNSFPDVKPKKRPESDKYKGRTYDIYSVEIDGKDMNVIEFKDGKRISSPQILQMFAKYASSTETFPGKRTSKEILKFLEDTNPTYDEFVRHFTAKRLNKGGVAEQMEMFGYTAEGAQQEADKFVEEAGDLETDISNAASSLVPFYDSGVNIVNVAQEYMKPEQERDYEYIKDQFREAGQSAAIEGGLLLMGGVAGKYGAKGIKALADKVKQYEIDPTAMSAFGAGAIKKKSDDVKDLTKDSDTDAIKILNIDENELESWKEKNYSKDKYRVPPIEKLEESAKALREGNITSSEFRELSDAYQPIVAIKEMPNFPTKKEVVQALHATDKRKVAKGIIGVNKEIPDGTPISARLDIPAYNHTDTWIVSLHDGTEINGNTVGYAQTAILDNVKFTSNPLAASSIASGKAKTTIARMNGSYVNADPNKVYETAKELLETKAEGWSQVGMNPYRASYFYDKSDGMPVVSADQVIQVGPLVMAKNVKKTTPDDKQFEFFNKVTGVTRKFKEGGIAMDDQMEMAFMQEGGIMDDGMDVDPVSGNEVPPGSLAEEVRDDIPAQLSEGEYVVPADVVRYYGVKFFEDLRDEAKRGLADMEANGRIGGEPVPEGGPKNENLTPEEQQAVEAMMGMEQGGAVQNPYLQQQQLYNQEPPKAVGNTMGYSMGGSPAPVNQLQAQAITPTVYNQPNYSFLSPSTVTQTSQTTEQAINQATQNVFSPVMMRSPEGVEAEAKTRAQMKQWLAAGWVIITAAETTTTPTETTTTPTDTTTTPTTTPRTGGGGTNITVGGKTGTGGFGFKNWGEDVDWSNIDSVKTFVENSTQGLLDPKTGKKITEVGFGIAGPVGGALGAAASTVPSLSSLSDLRASRFILQAQGMETDFVDAQIKKITDNASGFTNFIDKVFGEVADGDAKGRAALDRLGLEYTRDEKTGDPTFTPEQIAANKAKAKRPATSGDADPVITTSKGPTGIAGERIVSTPTKPEPASSPQEAQAAARKRRKDRRDKQRQRGALMKKRRDTAVKKARSITKGKAKITGKGAKAVDSRKKSGAFDKGGLMKKGDK